MPMIHWISWLRSESVLAAMLMPLVFVGAAQEASLPTTRIPARVPLKVPMRVQNLVGWGEYGLFFSVPKRGVKIFGGKPDVDYVKFVIKPTNQEATLTLWFGAMAFHP